LMGESALLPFQATAEGEGPNRRVGLLDQRAEDLEVGLGKAGLAGDLAVEPVGQPGVHALEAGPSGCNVVRSVVHTHATSIVDTSTSVL
jgi:hypothetical protein